MRKSILLVNRKKVFTFIFVLLAYSVTAQNTDSYFIAPSQLGVTGLIHIPIAYTPEWGDVHIGFTHFTKKASLSYEAGMAPERSFLASIVFLPKVELSLNLSRPYNNLVKNPSSNEKYYGIGDRSISLRVKVVEEKENRPAILIGIQDLGTKSAFFKTNYLVLSKKIRLQNLIFLTSLGYGHPIGEAQRIFLKGPFGGIQAYWKSISGIIEYDTKQFNYGISYQIKKCIAIKLALIDGRNFTGNISARFHLKKI